MEMTCCSELREVKSRLTSMPKLQALVYDILPWRKVPESDVRSVKHAIQKSSGMNLAERRLRRLELCLSKERGMCLYAEVVTEVDRLVLSFQPTCHRVRRRRNTCVLGMEMPA